VLRFDVTDDRRHEPSAYVSMRRGAVQVAALRSAVPDARAARLPPAGMDDVGAERDRVVAAGWPLEQDLQDRPWGLTDFRILDPAGYYLRVTSR
jgi:lactoylglutathione lyase